METKTIAIISVFAALSVVLNLSPAKIAAPFAPFLYYQIWEIPIVAAFILYGVRVGVGVAVINTMVLLAVFPGALPTGPLYNFAAVLSTLLGIYIIFRFVARYFTGRWEGMLGAFSTALGIIARVGIMSIVNWVGLRYPPPIGYGYPEGAIITLLPLIGFFNATLALYTIPLGYFIARAVSVGTKTPAWAQKYLKTRKI
jgi:riboflavin transporter FmnP